MTLLNVSSILSNPVFKVPFSFYNDERVLDRETGYFSHADTPLQTGYGSIQPVEREELHEIIRNVVGGEAVRDAIIVYTATPLTSGKLGTDSSFSGSIVTYKNLNWLIVDIEDYEGHGHVEAIGVRIDGQND